MAALLWPSTCLLLALCFQAHFGFAQIVSDPSSYELLSGPLVVGWSLKPGLRVSTERLEIYKTSDDRAAVTAVVLPLNVSGGRATFDCGLLHDAGEYFVQLSDGRSSLARSRAFAATWPELDVTLPAEHVAQSLPAAVARIEASDKDGSSRNTLLCQPLLNSGSGHGSLSPFEIQMWQLPAAGASVAEIGKWLLNNRPASLVALSDEGGSAQPAEQAVVKIYQSAVAMNDVAQKAAVITLPCELLDTAGYYQLSLAVKGTAIATSKVMTVNFADSYRLSINRSSVFPCVGGFQAHYTRASCSKVDVVRLYALRPSSVTGSANMVYLYERRSSSDVALATGAAGSSSSTTSLSVLSFDCNDIIVYHMENHATEIYCVKHLTMSANGSMLVELAALCLPVNASVTPPVDGQWSDWSDWTPCTSRCSPGQQSRHRYCNRPSPSAGGRMCPGNSVQWRACGQPCSAAAAALSTTVEPRRQGTAVFPSAGSRVFAPGDWGATPVRSGIDVSPEKSNCRCGCKLLEPAGAIVVDDIQLCLTNAGDASSAVQLTWLVHNLTSEYANVAVAIVAHALSPGCSLRIRDGPDPSDRLLAASAGVEPPGNVTSSGPTVQIELAVVAAAHGDKPSQLQHSDLGACSFTAIYASRDANEELSVSQLNPSEPAAVSLSSSHMIVIIGCSSGAALTIVFITAVVFLRKRCQRSTADSAEHSDVKDGVAVIEGDESNISHLHRQVHNGQYIHFKHELPSELVTPCEEEAPNKAEAAAIRRGKRAGVRLDSGSSSSPRNRRTAGHSLPRSATMPNPKLGQELLVNTGTSTPQSSHHHSVSMLPDPYHVRPEDFVHSVDLLHSSRHRKSSRPAAAAAAAAARDPQQGIHDHGRRKNHRERRHHDDGQRHAGGVKRKPDGNSGRERAQQSHSKHGKRKQSRQTSSTRGKARASAGAPEEETLLALSGASSSSPAVPAVCAAIATPRTNRSAASRRPDQLQLRAASSAAEPDTCMAGHAESEALLHSLPPPILESSS